MTPPANAEPLSRRRWPRAVALITLALSLGGCVACRLLHSGPYRAPQPLPEAKLLDMHVHTAGIGAGDSGCFISKQMESSWKLSIYLKSFGTTRQELQQKGDAHVIQLISQQLSGSKHVGQAILLAMDGVVDEKGELDKSRTEIYVPNAFIARETAKTTNLLFGASINPLRKDALAQLDWAATKGARLVKWIPSIMQFDPADERLTPFYKQLVELKLPLLTHAGQERSFTSARDELCDPQRLHLPLKLGVTVIVAHIASTGSNEGQRDTDRLASMMATYTNLFSEISSLTQVNKLGYLREALTRPEWQGRLLFGSDFPLINTALCSPHFYPLQLNASERSRLAAIENPWDRDVELKQALGVPREVFHRPRELFPNTP
ncbi:MAG: metal-dependent hydrolase [Verrucomicrobia bacterium]|nr:metal-dependent hydrolase [Verrucomicrobiota bacterium]